jgi:hypothetical protein
MTGLREEHGFHGKRANNKSPLTTIDVSRASIGEHGARNDKSWYMVNGFLARLSLRGNPAGGGGAVAFLGSDGFCSERAQTPPARLAGESRDDVSSCCRR